MKRGVLALCLGFMIHGCNDLGTTIPFQTEPITEDFSHISDPKARWAAYGLSNYVFEQQLMCFCANNAVCRIIVRNDIITDVMESSFAFSAPTAMWFLAPAGGAVL